MLLLTSTSDLIQVISGSASQIDVHTSYVDLDASGNVTAGRLNTRISTASTTTVVGSPTSGSSRNVKSIKIGNNHASVSSVVTLQHTDGANIIILEQVTLAPGERLGYEDGTGIRYFDSQGREKTAPLSGPWGNSNNANVTANAADTYLDGSQIAIGQRIQARSGFHWRFRCTKTGAGTATPTFNIRTGTAGTTADTSRCLFTSTAAQTAVTDTGWFDLEAHFTAAGATAVLDGHIRMDHSSADAVGLGTFRYIQTTSAAFDVTPTATIIGVSCNPGASGVWTFQLVRVEAYNLIS